MSVTFNGTALPNVKSEGGIRRPREFRVGTAPTPGYKGVYAENGIEDARRIVVAGVVNALSRTAIVSAWEALQDALTADGAPHTLLIDGRYSYQARLVRLVDTRDDGWGAIEYEAEFLAADPTETRI